MKNITTDGFALGEKEQLKAEVIEMLLPKIAPAVESVKKRYKLRGRRFTKRDFFRICAAEKIEVANTAAFRFMLGFDQIKGCLMRHSTGQVSVYLRSFFEAELDLFTAAHELAHFYLHTDNAGTSKEHVLMRLDGQRTDSDLKEIEADLFASLLLKH